MNEQTAAMLLSFLKELANNADKLSQLTPLVVALALLAGFIALILIWRKK